MQLKIDESFAEKPIPANDSVRLLDKAAEGMDLSAPLRAYSVEVLIHGYPEHGRKLIEHIEAGVLNIVFVIHDGTGITVNDITKLLMRHALTLTGFLDSKSDSVKVKFALVPFNFHSITT